MEEEVKLHGFWPSPFSHRVIWALKLKGVKYDYIEEDFPNKSQLLLQYNPVHKKIPVLVHRGKPIAESLIILEYIEETWPEHPLLPKDAYERALARFWIKYGEEKGLAIWKLYRTTGEEFEKAMKESLEILRNLEEHALGEKKFFSGERIGIVDIAFGWIAHWLGVIEDLIGVKLLEADSFPRLHAWIKNFKEESIIKENLPDCGKVFAHLKRRREMWLASP
ncbi:hypothetical protein F0562_035285 [Nyssa sinensis]|uniref:Glutathione S-transferase n=1 Tax=Nyssa sinensis TaxID=561372 RepID=A0A5J5ADP9_9ASTE|nr:hypothetical protein F0562_035285 [Nyssa sinensis]